MVSYEKLKTARKNGRPTGGAYIEEIFELRRGTLAALPIENLSMIRETNILYHRDFNHPEILDALTRLYRESVKDYQ